MLPGSQRRRGSLAGIVALPAVLPDSMTSR